MKRCRRDDIWVLFDLFGSTSPVDLLCWNGRHFNQMVKVSLFTSCAPLLIRKLEQVEDAEPGEMPG